MAKDNFADWDTTAANNTDVGGINIDEGCPPSNINNAIRTVMAQLKSGVSSGVAYVSKSGSYTTGSADNGKFFEFTATATLSISAVGTLPANWSIWVMANGGDVTIDPNGTEQVNGATTALVPNGTTAFLISTGSAFKASGIPSVWTISSADAGAAVGPLLSLFRNSASPAASDVIGGLYFDGRDSAANKQTYASIETIITDATSASEDGSLLLRAAIAGVLTTILTVNGGTTTLVGGLTTSGAINVTGNSTINGTLTVTG